VVIYTDGHPPLLTDVVYLCATPRIEVVRPLSKLRLPAEYDLVCGFPILAAEWALREARRIGVPCINWVLDPHDMCKRYAPVVAGRMHYSETYRKALHDSARLIACVDYAVPFIKRWTGNDDVKAVLGCVNSVIADSVQTERVPNRVVTVTRLTEHKNVPHMLEAIRALGFARLHVITSFSAPQIGQMARRMGIVDLVVVHDTLSEADKYELMKSASVFLSASQYEGLGLPMLEAVYCGTPCVLYDFPVFHETVGKAARYARYCDVKSLADTLSTMLGDQEVYQKHAQSAVEVGRRYRFEAMLPRLANAIKLE